VWERSPADRDMNAPRPRLALRHDARPPVEGGPVTRSANGWMSSGDNSSDGQKLRKNRLAHAGSTRWKPTATTAAMDQSFTDPLALALPAAPAIPSVTPHGLPHGIDHHLG